MSVFGVKQVFLLKFIIAEKILQESKGISGNYNEKLFNIFFNISVDLPFNRKKAKFPS